MGDPRRRGWAQHPLGQFRTRGGQVRGFDQILGPARAIPEQLFRFVVIPNARPLIENGPIPAFLARLARSDQPKHTAITGPDQSRVPVRRSRYAN